jgi:hypothetical protein
VLHVIMPLPYRQVRGVGFGTVVQGAEPSVAERGCRGVVTAAVDTHGAAPDPGHGEIPP